MSNIIQKLSEILADTYALYLKTQNYHWNVTGPTFKMHHELFEEQYEQLAEAVDVIAERIRALGHKAPGTFSEFQKLTCIEEGRKEIEAPEMVRELADDHHTISEKFKKIHELAEKESDLGTAALIEDRVREHDKTHWMLIASLDQETQAHALSKRGKLKTA